MDKIIGFTLAKNKINHTDIDIFHRGIKLREFRKNGYYFYLWGIGNPESCMINNKYTLSFPLSETLLDRNVLIDFQDNHIIVENDWLGSIPIFYNESECIISTLSLKTLTNDKIHPEGLANFVECGFSILCQTPFYDVKFMRYYSKLIINAKGISSILKEDPVLDSTYFSIVSNENDVSLKIKRNINDFEKHSEGNIIIPTSGGYDSRMINLYVEEKSRIRAFSYGISDIQSESSEVIYAKKVAEILHIDWEQIELGKYHDFIEKWFEIFGVSTHLHGMYHIEFYNKIISDKKFNQNSCLISGIVGDAWSGNVNIRELSGINDIPALAYSHGMNADSSAIKIPFSQDLRKTFFNTQKNHLKATPVRTIFLIRFKLILLSYLMTIPEYYGIPSWTPFLNFDIVVGMLTLPENRKKDRKWQKDLFEEYHVNVEADSPKKDMSNTLNQQAFLVYNFTSLNVELLQKYFKAENINEINNFISDKPKNSVVAKIQCILMCNRYSRYCLRNVGIQQTNPLSLLYAYYVLKPIEMGLIMGARNDT
jgi:hypothetical protein